VPGHDRGAGLADESGGRAAHVAAALSHQIAAIERELGTPVIERLPRGTRPFS
jgi:predicted HD phosphohydrolase